VVPVPYNFRSTYIAGLNMYSPFAETSDVLRYFRLSQRRWLSLKTSVTWRHVQW